MIAAGGLAERLPFAVFADVSWLSRNVHFALPGEIISTNASAQVII
jgi:hypothetical protein